MKIEQIRQELLEGLTLTQVVQKYNLKCSISYLSKEMKKHCEANNLEHPRQKAGRKPLNIFKNN